MDWWGLGVLLYVLLTGRQPFSSPKTVSTLQGEMMGLVMPGPGHFTSNLPAVSFDRACKMLPEWCCAVATEMPQNLQL